MLDMWDVESWSVIEAFDEDSVNGIDAEDMEALREEQDITDADSADVDMQEADNADVDKEENESSDTDMNDPVKSADIILLTDIGEWMTGSGYWLETGKLMCF